MATTTTTTTPILIPDVYDGSPRPAWNTFAAATAFSGVILKATDGVSYAPAESWFVPNWLAARNAAMAVHRYRATFFLGAYHYLQFSDHPVDQAKFYLKTLSQVGWGNGDLIPIVDVERGQPTSHNHQAPKSQVEDCTTMWVETVKNELGADVKVMLYGMGAMRDLGITSRMDCDYLWVPQYGHTLDMSHVTSIGWPPSAVMLWQYTDGNANYTGYPATAPGLGATDLSVFLGGGTGAPLTNLCLQR